MGIAATLSGALIVSCWQTHSVYAIDPFTGHCERIAGSGSDGGLNAIDSPLPALSATFDAPTGLVVVDTECSAYVCDYQHCAVHRITLPRKY